MPVMKFRRQTNEDEYIAGLMKTRIIRFKTKKKKRNILLLYHDNRRRRRLKEFQKLGQGSNKILILVVE